MTPNYDKQAVLDAALARGIVALFEQDTRLKQYGKEWRGACPLHNGKNANFAVNPETSLYHCHTCKVSGDIFTFVQAMRGVDFPGALSLVAEFAGVSDTPHSTPPRRSAPAPKPAPAPVFLDPALAADAHNRLINDDAARLWLAEYRGLTTETLTRYQIGLIPAQGGDEPRLTIPVYGARGSLLNIRKHLPAWRPGLTDERRRELGKTKQWQAGLTTGTLFPLSALDGVQDVLLVEGELDALLASQLGIACVTGTGGAPNWKLENTEALRGKCVTVLYDNDGPGQSGQQSVAKTLFAAGVCVSLLHYPEDVKDLTEWVVTHGATVDDVRRAIAAAVPFAPTDTPNSPHGESPQSAGTATPPKRKTIAESVIDLADVPPPGEIETLFGQYFVKGLAHWLTGATGIGKSTLLYNILCAMAEGTELWGIACEQRRVLYLDLESGTQGRGKKIERLYRDAPRVRGQLLFLDDALRYPDELPALIEFAKERAVDLVVFDTARRNFAVKDENDNSEFYQKIVPVLDALKSAGVATLTLGHPSKNGNGSARGASSQEDAGDANLSLTMHRGDKDDPKGIVILRVTKNRLLGMDIPPLILRRAGNDHFERVDEADALPPETTKPLTKKQQCAEMILTALGARDGSPLSYNLLTAQMNDCGFSLGTSKTAIKELSAAGKIVKHDVGYLLPAAAVPRGMTFGAAPATASDALFDKSDGGDDEGAFYDGDDPFHED